MRRIFIWVSVLCCIAILSIGVFICFFQSKAFEIKLSGKESPLFKESLLALKQEFNEATTQPIDFYQANFIDTNIPKVENRHHTNILWLGSKSNFDVSRIKDFDYVFVSTPDLKAYLETYNINTTYLPVFIQDKDYTPSFCATHQNQKDACFWLVVGNLDDVADELEKRNYNYQVYPIADSKTTQKLNTQIDSIAGIVVDNALMADDSLDLSPFFIMAARHQIPLLTHIPDDNINSFKNYPVTVFNDHIFYWLHKEDIATFFNQLNNSSGAAAARFAKDFLSEKMTAMRIRDALAHKDFKLPVFKDKITFNVYTSMGDITIGDYAVAKDLKKAFQNFGYFPEVIFPASLFKESGIANIFFRGAAELKEDKKAADSVYIFWLLYPYYSQFDDIDSEEIFLNKMKKEFQYADVVATASLKLYHLMQNMGVPSYYVPQFTNTARFYPDYHEDLRSDVLFVGTNTWYRKSALILLKNHLPITIYGPKWDKGVALAPYIPNDILHKYYSSAKIVLNDTRPDMQQLGFISNRVFDATACGALVISDYMPEIEEVYGDSVPMWKTEDELTELVKYYLAPAHEAERKEKAERARQITLKNFTSDIVAQKFKQIIDDVKKEKGLK